MKVYSILILSLIVFVASFQNSLIWVDYELHKDFYEIHCINNDKPELECHGKCKISEEAEKSSSTQEVVKIHFDFNFYKPQTTILLPVFIEKRIADKMVISDNMMLLSAHNRIFPEPPRV